MPSETGLLPESGKAKTARWSGKTWKRPWPRPVIAVIGIVCVLIILAVGVEIAVRVEGVLAYAKARKEAVEFLTTSTQSELRSQCLFYSLADGSWIAIRYRDSHGFPGVYSLSVARCSDGTWFESSHHYCGTNTFARRFDEHLADMRAYASPDEVEAFRMAQFEDNLELRKLVAIHEAPDLESAKRLLEGVHFVRMEAPAK